MPDLTPRQLALLRILADADGPQAASYVAARYMEAHPGEVYGRSECARELWDLALIGNGGPFVCPFLREPTILTALWEIAPAGRKALKAHDRRSAR